MESKYLSDVINYSTDIEPYTIIEIISGVGSGKNYWVETLAKQGKRILLITSRKITADAQAQKLGCSRWIDLEDLWLDDTLMQSPPHQVVVTNAGIEQFIKTRYKKDDEQTHIWKYFDLIILDEAHSLVTDATFADSPFHVLSFLRYVRVQAPSCKIIFMTGTPDPIEQLFQEKLTSRPYFRRIDARSQCKCVEPKMVTLYPSFKIEEELVECINDGYRVIYFANSITRMESMVKTLLELGLPECAIGIAYSGDDKRDFPKSLLDNKPILREKLTNDELLPPEIKIFLTTSQNKEGININNDDIKLMLVESCEHSDIVQMAGRVRKGLDELYILYDAKPHTPIASTNELLLSIFCIEGVQAYWEFQQENLNDNKANNTVIASQIITMLERKFPNIRYDYLFECWRSYEQRDDGFILAEYSSHSMHYITKRWGFGAVEDFQAWFPNSEIYYERSYSPKQQIFKITQELETIINQGNYLNRIITKEEKTQFLTDINKMINDSYCNPKEMGITYPVKRLNTFLKKFGYSIHEVDGIRKGTAYQVEALSDCGEIA